VCGPRTRWCQDFSGDGGDFGQGDWKRVVEPSVDIKGASEQFGPLVEVWE
jgi:hypothetical protein